MGGSVEEQKKLEQQEFERKGWWSRARGIALERSRN